MVTAWYARRRRPPHSGAAAWNLGQAHRLVVSAHGNDTESLAHGEGVERAVLVNALERVQPLELREGALVREVVRRDDLSEHPEHLRLEPRKVLKLRVASRVAALEAKHRSNAAVRACVAGKPGPVYYGVARAARKGGQGALLRRLPLCAGGRAGRRRRAHEASENL